MQDVAGGGISIQKQRGKWAVRQVGYDPASGRRRVRQLGTFDTKKAAQAHARSVAEGRIGSARETVEDYLVEVWLRSVVGRVEENTIAQYRWAIERHIVPLIGATRLRDLTPEAVDDWITALMTPDADGRSRLGLTSTRLVRKVLSMGLENAVQRGHLQRNPVALSRPPRARRSSKQRKGWTLPEARAFLASTDGHRYHAAFHLGLVTGLRRGELMGLNWADIDLDDGLIELSRQYVVVRGNPVLKDLLKTDSSERLIAVGSRTTALLVEHRQRQGRELSVLGLAGSDNPVFTDEMGERLRPDTFSRAMKRLCDEAGVPVLTPKGLRHTAQSIGRVAVGDDKVMQERLGHADIEMTLNTYTHTVPEQHRVAGDKIDEIFQ